MKSNIMSQNDSSSVSSNNIMIIRQFNIHELYLVIVYKRRNRTCYMIRGPVSSIQKLLPSLPVLFAFEKSPMLLFSTFCFPLQP